jgi:hypothetical protein
LLRFAESCGTAAAGDAALLPFVALLLLLLPQPLVAAACFP